MHCPFCDHKDTRVLESRLTAESTSVRRRRSCENCDHRFTTYERVEEIQLLAVKRSGDREPYLREKIRAGVSRACAKTTVTAEQIDDLIESLEYEISGQGQREIPTSLLGELALRRLKDINQVAYVRFASVYRQFRSIKDFVEELDTLKVNNSVSTSGS
jgi:transcriptional repressor NrdR